MLSVASLAGQLAGRVGAHAVGHDEQMAAAAKLRLVLRQRDGERVLVAGPPHTDVAHGCAVHAAGRLRQFDRRFRHRRWLSWRPFRGSTLAALILVAASS